MVEITGRYLGDLACEAVHGPSGATLRTEPPADNAGSGAAFSPTDLVATAFGTCVVTILAIVAERHGVDVGGTTFLVTKEMASEPHRRIARLALTVRVPATVPESRRPLLERAASACPVHHSLGADVEAPITFVYV